MRTNMRQNKTNIMCSRTLVQSHALLWCCSSVQCFFFCLQLLSEWEVLGLLGELWSSILSGCLMEQAASVDNVKGCVGGRWWFLCQNGGTGMKLRDYSSDISQRRQIEKGGKNPGKQFMFVTWFSLAGAAFPYQQLAVFPQFLPLFFTSALKPATAALSPFS